MIRKLYIIFFLFFYLTISASTDLKILQSTNNYLIVEYTPVYNGIDTITVKGEEYLNVNLLNGNSNSLSEFGLPQIQFRNFNAGVPGEYGNTIQVLNADYRISKGKLLPIPFFKETEFSYTKEYILKDEYGKHKPGELVTFGDFGYVRELPVQTIKISPIQFNASKEEIRLYKSIRFRINFAAQPNEAQVISDKRLETFVLNYSIAKNWGKKEKRSDGLKKVSASSPLNSGVWYKFTTPNEGMYKIDFNSLSQYGIDPSTVDPRTIKIYNNGGAQLPESIDLSNEYNLNEIAIQVVGEADGKFDSGDYIIFYGRPTDFFYYDKTLNQIIRNKHFYSKENYFFITSGGSNGKRIENKVSLNQSGVYKQTTTLSNAFHEDDILNIKKSGRIYVGESFSSSDNSHSFLTSLPNFIQGSRINYNISFVNFSEADNPPNSSIVVSENGNQILSRTLRRPFYFTDGYQNIFSTSFIGNLQDSRSNLKFLFQANSPDIAGYLDYFEIQYQSYLRANSDVVTFYSKDTTTVVEYNLSDFTNSAINLYDVSDFSKVRVITNASISGGQAKFQANETEGNVSKYLACTSAQLLAPSNPVKMDNSNLLGEVSGTEFIIITNKVFKDQALKLKDYRSQQSKNKISTKVVYIDEIFNEFSNGILDPTAVRNFLKFAYENWQPKPFYVLFFGDGSYDYLNKEGYDNNFIPTFQTIESFDYVRSFPSDDYFARVVGSSDKGKIDLAHGRLCVNTAEEAELIVDKIIEYETEQPIGVWRQRMTLIADDSWTSEREDGHVHTSQSEVLSRTYIPKYFDQNKIYLAAYPVVNTGLGRRKPDVNAAIINAVNNGTLILNFIGHGNRKTWAHERVLERSTTIPQFKNSEYFFMTAATCNFGEYDNPGVPSATEEMVLLEGRGMIGGFSASRPVYSTPNSLLNNAFFNNLFNQKDSLNRPVRIGWAFMKAKEDFTGNQENEEKFHIFCDPTLKLNVPEIPASIDSINGNSVEVDVKLSALGSVLMSGRVLKNDSTFNSGFNGEAIISVFDSERMVELKELGGNNVANRSMVVQGGVIFRGRVSVANGNFNASFVVPKDISYDDSNGKVVAYVFNDDNDGIGFTDKILIGGTDSTIANDGNGPEIDIYYDNFEYDNSYMVDPNFTLLVKLNDETGLNTTGTGVGHKLEGIINEDEQNTLDLTNAFIGDLDSGGKSGTIKYKFSSLDVGDYDLKIKAWDVFNNPTVEESYFTVINSDDIVLRDVVNYPNPFSSTTTFTFQHNYNSPVNVKIKVYTVAGRLIKNIEQNNINEKFVKVFWDGLDEDGNIPANGTYFYKLIVKTIDGSHNENVLGKMAVIR